MCWKATLFLFFKRCFNRIDRQMKIDAVLWDYDGTLANSVPKNIHITKQIIAKVSPQLTGDNLPHYLKSEEAYHIANHESKNWQDLYVNFYGMTDDEMLEAGALWTQYQLIDKTSVELFDGIKEIVGQISLPQGICSQNSSKNILEVLNKNKIGKAFNAIVGYDDIPNNTQKPHPYSGLKCLEKLHNGKDFSTVIYIGDHESDVTFAHNIEKELSPKTQVLSVIVKYSGANTASWKHKPDYVIDKPSELLEIIR